MRLKLSIDKKFALIKTRNLNPDDVLEREAGV